MTHHKHDFDPEEDGPDFRSRRAHRVAVEKPASMVPQSRYTVEIKVRDVSAAGFMAECAEPVLIGSYVSLDIPGIGPVHAQVRWQVGSKLGGMFLDPISLKTCEWTAEPNE